MSPEANQLLAKIYATGKGPFSPRGAAWELINAGLAKPAKHSGIEITKPGRFAAWQAQNPS